MLFSTTVTTDQCKGIEGTITLQVQVSSLTIAADGIYVNYQILLPGSGQVSIKAGQTFFSNDSPVWAALSKPIDGIGTVFTAIAPSIVEQTV
jgi:hypothetical protein